MEELDWNYECSMQKVKHTQETSTTRCSPAGSPPPARSCYRPPASRWLRAWDCTYREDVEVGDGAPTWLVDDLRGYT
eukprot:COSAG02_NODE_18429_length_939_cov_1.009524_2_plen_76_part_01